MEKKKKKRFAYLDDFETDDNGNYIYKGTVYGFDEASVTWGRACLYLWLFLGAAAVCQVACGCIPAAGMFNTAYVIIPYALALLMIGLTAYRMVNLSFTGSRVREYVYAKTVEKFEAELYIAIIFMGLTALGEVSHDAASGLNIWTLVFLTVQLLGVLACLGFIRYLNAQVWGIVQKKETDNG
ncbi:MAG: hypothetical protein K6G61_05755 [Solobacterium sp.]|nr:hypothetical protein [Solobacterium sp.]